MIQRDLSGDAMGRVACADRIPVHGVGNLHCALVHGASTAIGSYATAPLKLLISCPRGPAVHACVTTYGGGLVAGDHIALRLRIDTGACCVLGTQATTKVYRSDNALSASQELDCHVGAAGLLAVLPDPTTCYAQARYQQTTRVRLHETGSLLLLDWLTSGRSARGESWEFTSYAARTEVSIAERVRWRDAVHLGGEDLIARMGRHHVLAHALMLGHAFARISAELIARVATMPVAKHATLLVSASPLADGVLLRLAATTHHAAQHTLRDLLAPALALAGGDPWLRRG